MQGPFPVPNSTLSFWRTHLHSLDSHRSSEHLPHEADFVIIGAGYSGATIAYHLLDKTKRVGQSPSIVILEAREACSGATGRNGGHLKPDPYLRASAALDSHGPEAAEEVASFEVDNLKAVAQLLKDEEIDCDWVLTRACDVALYEEGFEELKFKCDKLSKAGISAMGDVFCSSEETAERISGIKGAKGCLTYSAGHLWPYKLVSSLLARAIAAGVNLQTFTPVRSVSETQDEDGRWTINSARGSIKAAKVVFATNGYSAALIPELKKKVVPVRGICSRIVSPKAYPPFLANSIVLRFNEWEYDYLIPRTDGSIVVGGARRDYHMNLKEWFDVSDDSKLIEPAKHYFDGYMQRHFHGWEDSEAYTDKVWTGIMGYTSDGFPHVGEVPDKSGQYICAGFNGHGMSQIFLSANALATVIAEDVRIEHTGLPRMYRTSRERFDSQEQHVSLAAWDAIPKKARANL